MTRYHKQVYIPDNYISKLKDYTDSLNSLKWSYTPHCLDNLKHRVINRQGVLNYIKNKRLDWQNVFEFYTNDKGDITKAVYRFSYIEGLDLILVISPIKKIITIYINSSDDKHYTLKRELYQKI